MLNCGFILDRNILKLQEKSWCFCCCFLHIPPVNWNFHLVNNLLQQRKNDTCVHCWLNENLPITYTDWYQRSNRETPSLSLTVQHSLRCLQENVKFVIYNDLRQNNKNNNKINDFIVPVFNSNLSQSVKNNHLHFYLSLTTCFGLNRPSWGHYYKNVSEFWSLVMLK